MSWNVGWVPDAEDHLTAVWLAAADRNAVTAAAARIEQLPRPDDAGAAVLRHRPDR